MSGSKWRIQLQQSEKTIGDLEIRKTYSVTIIAVMKKNMKKLFNPGPETVIEEGDMLVVSGEREEIKKIINELLSNRGGLIRWIR